MMVMEMVIEMVMEVEMEIGMMAGRRTLSFKNRLDPNTGLYLRDIK